MKKEYVTVRLFKNRAADGMITEEELYDSDQQQSTETCNNSLENIETVESSANSNKSLPQRVLNVLQRALVVLRLDRKD